MNTSLVEMTKQHKSQCVQNTQNEAVLIPWAASCIGWLQRAKPELTWCDHHQSCGKGKVGDIRPNPWNQSQETATTRCRVEKALILRGGDKDDTFSGTSTKCHCRLSP